MKTTKTNAFFLLLLMVFISSTLFSAPHCSAKVYREKCGKNATWRYNTKTKVLKISGKGAITETIAAGEKKGAWGEGKPLKVKKIVISEGITSLNCPDGLFGNVSDINYGSISMKNKKVKIQLPNSLKSIGSLSFLNWPADITIPQNVKYIAPVSIEMDSYSSDYSLSVASDNPYFCMVDGVLLSKNKKRLIYYPQNRTQETYTVPRSVRKIAPMAFQSASHLRKVILPDKLKKLGSGAFYRCINLEYVNLSDKMKIKSITDYDTSKLEGTWDYVDDEGREIYRLKESSSSDNRYASDTRAGTFEGTLISSIHIPNSVKYLSSNTFFTDRGTYTFTNLREISFGKNFSGKINTGNSQSGMKTLTLFGGVKLKISIPKSNKKYCVQDGILYNKDKTVVYFASGYKGKNLTLPKTVKKIANGAFANTCTSNVYKIQHVTIPGDIESIGYNAFAGSLIKTFTCNGKINQMGKYAFSGCSALKTVKIGELKEIPDYAFSECQSLKTVNCGTKVEKIGSYAFSGCSSITKVTVGNQIQSMPKYTFDDCTSLSQDAIPKTQYQQMEVNFLTFRQLIMRAYKAYS